MQTLVKSSKHKWQWMGIVFCDDPECGEDKKHAYFVINNIPFFGSFRFDLTGLA